MKKNDGAADDNDVDISRRREGTAKDLRFFCELPRQKLEPCLFPRLNEHNTKGIGSNTDTNPLRGKLDRNAWENVVVANGNSNNRAVMLAVANTAEHF